MIKFDVKSDFKEVERILGSLAKEIVPQAASTAINRTLVISRKTSTKLLEMSIKAESAVTRVGANKLIKLTKSKVRTLTGSLRIKNTRIPAINFKTRSVKGKGIYVTTKAGSTFLKGAFKAKMPGGHKGIFYRRTSQRRGNIKTVKKGKNAGRTYRANLPITERTMPGIGFQFFSTKVFKTIDTQARKAWPREFAKAMKARVARLEKTGRISLRKL